jgi:hypothetical protein
MRDSFSPMMVCVLQVAFAALVWAGAQGNIAKDCEKLGSFYYGNQTFECKIKGTTK